LFFLVSNFATPKTNKQTTITIVHTSVRIHEDNPWGNNRKSEEDQNQCHHQCIPSSFLGMVERELLDSSQHSRPVLLSKTWRLYVTRRQEKNGVRRSQNPTGSQLGSLLALIACMDITLTSPSNVPVCAGAKAATDPRTEARIAAVFIMVKVYSMAKSRR
jgi:hypothetical protein